MSTGFRCRCWTASGSGPLPAWAQALIAEQAAESERWEIRSELERAGLL